MITWPSRNALDIHMNSESWSLHPQLVRDTIELGDLALSRVLVIKDANYPGCCWSRGGATSWN